MSASKNFTEDRIKLIYEFNARSPLFARVAASKIEHGNFLEAIKILEEGIRLYPSYPTPYFILAIAYAYAGNEEEAISSASIGSEIINSPQTLEHYTNKIEKITAERNSLKESKRTQFFEKSNEFNNGAFSNSKIEEKLDLLADLLSKAKLIPKLEDTDEEVQMPQVQFKKIVSETLAEIFLSQKNYSEAISIYEELMIQKPEKEEFYTKKINEIRASIE